MPEHPVRLLSRLSAVAVMAMMTAFGSLVPAAAAAPTGTACGITAGDLTWGFKESFRAYISGSIAHGQWATFDGATYATPMFSWAGATGSFDPTTSAGEIAFAGGIRFTGHDGLLDTSVSNPVLQLPGDGSARLLLDVSTLTMEDALAGNADAVRTAAAVPVVTLDLAAAPLRITDDAVIATDVPTAITAEGFEILGSYEPGTAFDPLALSVNLECADEPAPSPSMSPTAAPVPGNDTAASESTSAVTAWLPWTLAGVALAGAAGGVIVWLGRRGGRRAQAGADAVSRSNGHS